MATLSAAMVTLLTDNWAGAGAAPTFGALIDYQKDIADTTEQVIVRLPIHEDVTPINDTYSNFKFTMRIRVKSTVSEDRLKVLTDEVIRIINNYAITGVTRQFAKRGENTSDSRRKIYSYDVWAILEEHMSTGGTSYSSPGAGDVAFPADVTIAGALGVTGDATVPNLITAGDVDGVDVSEEPARITAEIAAAVQAEDTLAEMNDVDLTGLSDDDIIVYDLGTTTWKPEAPSAGVSGTQWTIPVFDTATSIGDSMITQDAGGTLATIGGDLTVTGNDIKGSDGTQMTMSANGVKFAGTIGVNNTAPSADYSFLDYSAGHKQFHLRSSDQTATMMMSGATGKDSSMTLREGTTQKAQFQYDASDNDSRFKSVPSGHNITLPDGGGIELNAPTVTTEGDLTVSGGTVSTPSSAAIDALGGGVIRLKLGGVEKVYVGATNTIFKNDVTVDNDILTQADKTADVGATGTAWDNMYADDYVNESPFIEIENPLEAVNAIKAKDGKLDYESMPDWVRATKRINQIKGIDWKGNPKVIRKGEKVVAEKGFSINRMCVLLYQALQEATARIEALEAA